MNTTQTPVFPQHYRLRLAMEQAGLDIDGMAAEIGMHRNSVLNYVSGRTRPNGAALRLWAMRTGVALEWLQMRDAQPDDGTTGGVTHREDLAWAS